MKQIREEIIRSLEVMKQRNEAEIFALHDRVSVLEYQELVREKKTETGVIRIWTDAFQRAIDEHEWIDIPASAEPYWIDDSLILHSNRHLEAQDGAVIRLAEDVSVLLLRNEHVVDGTHLPEDRSVAPDRNISIFGGRWEESYEGRKGYGVSGKFDEARSLHGVSTCMLFSNAENVTLKNMTFFHTAGFGVQFGNLKNLLCEEISFEQCFADGLHVNGNTENVWIRRVKGEVGDDMVALNMYDWLNSSINFGPMCNVLCENLTPSPSSRRKAFRIQPGFYRYDDGSQVDCSANRIIIRHVKGIRTFKLYLQTPPFPIDGEREYGIPGSGDAIFFEEIDVDLDAPTDLFDDYLRSDPVTGTCAAFELNSNLGCVTLENVRVNLHRDRLPQSYVLCVGPKSIRKSGREIFDPEHSTEVGELVIRGLVVNGEPVKDPTPYLREIVFDRLYGEEIYGKGEIRKITVEE